MYWADLGLPENYKDMIVNMFPIPDGIKQKGAYSLYYGDDLVGCLPVGGDVRPSCGEKVR